MRQPARAAEPPAFGILNSSFFNIFKLAGARGEERRAAVVKTDERPGEEAATRRVKNALARVERARQPARAAELPAFGILKS